MAPFFCVILFDKEKTGVEKFYKFKSVWVKKMKLTAEMIEALANDVGTGLSNRDAAKVNNIHETTLYDWLKVASTVRKTGKKRLTKRERDCCKLVDALESARLKRKQRFLEKLEDNKSPAGIIFLLKQAYPDEYNKEPVPLPNFEKLEQFMQAEYTQQEIEAIRKAIHAAEARRQSEVRYDENELFGDDDE